MLTLLANKFAVYYLAVNQLYHACKGYQFLSALALGLRPWARAAKTDAAFAWMI